MYSNSDDKTCFVQLVRSRCRESSCRNKSRVTDGSNPVLLCDTHSLSLSFLLSLLLVSTSLYVMSFLPLLVSLSIRRLLTYFKLPRSTGSGPVSVFLRFLFFFFSVFLFRLPLLLYSFAFFQRAQQVWRCAYRQLCNESPFWAYQTVMKFIRISTYMDFF